MKPLFKMCSALLLTFTIAFVPYAMHTSRMLSHGAPSRGVFVSKAPVQEASVAGTSEIAAHTVALAQEPVPAAMRLAPSVEKFKIMPGQSRTLLPDGHWLILGGMEITGAQDSAWLLDSTTDSILKLPLSMLHSRAWQTATVLPDGRVFILGGIGTSGGVENHPELFNPDTRTFEELQDAGISPRAHHTTTLLTDGRLLIAGGVNDAGLVLPVEIIDSTSRQPLSSDVELKKGRQDHTAILLPDGNVLLTGGSTDAGDPAAYRELFDSASNAVAIASDPPQTNDGQGPQLELSIPSYGASNVAVNAPIVLRFSRPLAVQSVNTQTAVLDGPYGPVGVTALCAEAGMLAFVTPNRALSDDTAYTLTLRGARDRNGMVLADVVVAFTTGSERDKDESGAESKIEPKDKKESREKLSEKFPTIVPLPPLTAPAGITAVSGRALTLDGRPLPDVTLRIDGVRDRTDGTGRFLLTGVASGHHELIIDGRTAQQGSKSYGVFEAGVDAIGGETTVLPYIIWMTPLDTAHAVRIPFPTQSEVVVTNPLLPGLEFHIPPHTTITDIDGNVAAQISITPVPIQQPPFPLPQGVDVPIYFTIQPGGGYIAVTGSEGKKGARLIYPNKTGLPVGSRVNFWNYEADGAGWYVYGQGSVSTNAESILPDPGVEIYELTGAMVGGIGSPNGRCPAKGCSREAGDPVDLGTGLFVYEKTDLFLDDVIPLNLVRTYRQNDTQARDFGRGTRLNYPLNLTGETSSYSYFELLLPDGGRVRFDRTSPGSNFGNAYLENWSTPGEYYGAWINLQGGDWTLTKRDGTIMTFPQYRPLSTITDRNGNRITINYRSFISSQVSNVSSSNGRYINFTYDASDRIIQAQDNIGRTVQYFYDSNSYLNQVIDANGGVWKYTYDASGRMTSLTDARNIQYLQNQYDAGGRVSLQTQSDGGTYQYAYVTNGSGQIIQTTVTDPRNNVRRVVFRAGPLSPSGFVSGGYPATETVAVGTSQEATISTQRQPGTNLATSSTDAMGRVTTYTYDMLGNVTSITKLSGTPGAVTTTFTYDGPFDKMKTVTDSLGRTTRFTYDAKGNLTAIIDPMGHTSMFTYNSAGQVLTATDPNGSVTQFSYSAGLLTSTTDPAGRTISRIVDGAGRPLNIISPDGTTVQEFNPLNLVTRITDAALGITDMTYDQNGNLLTVKDARNNTTTYTYDNMDRVATRRDPLLNIESFVYDGKGNLVQSTDRRGKVTTMNYDALDRPVFTGFGTLPGPAYESTVTNTYDAGNRLTQSVDSITGAVNLNYDLLNRLTSEASLGGTVNYGYDSTGRQTSMTVTGQPSVIYAYDDADRVIQMGQGSNVVSFAYDDGGRRVALQLPNGSSIAYRYTGSELSEITYASGDSQLGNLTYSYDGAGRTNRIGGSFARTGIPAPFASAIYNAGNELTLRSGASWTYDANGNVVSDGANFYTWNARNQLSSIGGGVAASFQYDALGRRVMKSVGGSTASYLYNGADIVQEVMGGGSIANLLNGGMDEVLLRTSPTGTDTFLADALGSNIALTDTSGTIQTQYSYEPFGKTTIAGATNTNQREFTGRENDGTGLYFYRARYYSPSLGRFISQDPLSFGGGDVNLYAYVGNSPIDGNDPGGKSLGTVHIWETYDAARAIGYTRWDALVLGIHVAGADFRRGAQEADANAANKHGMAGTLKGRKPQNACEAFDGTAKYVASADLAGALHDIEDAYVHRFASWDGGWNPFGIPIHLPGPIHLYHDLWYNNEAEAAAEAYLRSGNGGYNPAGFLPRPETCFMH